MATTAASPTKFGGATNIVRSPVSQTVSADMLVDITTDDIIKIDSTANTVNLSLPSVTTATNIHLIFKWTAGANEAKITTFGTETVNGALEYVFQAVGDYLWLICDGGFWDIYSANDTQGVTLIDSGTGSDFLADDGLYAAINIWANFAADTGIATADAFADTFNILGGANVSTAIVGDTLTIDADSIYNPSNVDITDGTKQFDIVSNFGIDKWALNSYKGATSATFTEKAELGLFGLGTAVLAVRSGDGAGGIVDSTGISASLSSGIIVQDESSDEGMYYDADYSTNGVANRGDRWIPDKGFLDAAILTGIGTVDHLNIANIGTNSHADIDNHISDATIHRIINDAATSLTELWSANKISTELALKADVTALTAHTGDATIHFTEASIDHTAITNVGTNSHVAIDSHINDLTIHRSINDAGSSTTDLWSADKIGTEISAVTGGVDFKDAVETCSDSDITLSGEQTINGVLTSASRVGVVGQSTAADNGIYVTAAGAWTRAADAATDALVTQGMTFFVSNASSTVNGSQYLLTTADPITVGVTALAFTTIARYELGTTAGTAAEGNDSRIATQDENDALVGTNGAPSTANKYVTNSDSRNTDSRTPTAHLLGSHSADTLANLNAIVSDATLIDTGDSRLSDSRTPTSHAASHENGGGDEISVAGLSGTLADNQQVASDATLTGDGTTGSPLSVVSGGAGDMLTSTYDVATIAEQLVGLTATQTLTNKTLTTPAISSPTGLVKADVGLANVDNTSDANKPVSTLQQTALDLKKDDFSENTGFNKNFGTASGDVCEGDDSRLSDARTPTAHLLGSHSADTLANLNAIVSDATLIDTGDSRLSDSRTPTSHASSHENGGGDEISVAGLSGTLADNQQVASDATLTGDGTTGSPLSVVSGGAGDMLTSTYDAAAIAEQLVGLTATQTLTNKTLTTPAISSPTGLVKADVGLANVDNTSDVNKPVSTAQQTALDLKKNDFSENTGFNKNFGTASGDVCEGDDSRLSDARTPTAHLLGSHSADTLANLNAIVSDATLIDTGDSRLSDDRDPNTHASDHQHGGSDEVATATAAANVIPKANGSGVLADGFISSSAVTQHEASITHQNVSGAGTNTHAQIDTHIADATIHRSINDAGSATTDLWSADKIATEVAGAGGGSGIVDSTGWLTGGILSVGTGSDDFSISDGDIQFVTNLGVKTDVSVSGLTDIVVTNIASQLITFVGVNASSTVIQQATAFTNIQTRTIAAVGVVVHVNLVSVDTVNIEQQIAYNVNSQLYDLATSIGFFNDSGNVFSPNGANLNIDKTIGAMFKAGSNVDTSADNPHIKNLPSLAALSFQYRFNDGSNGVTGIAIDPDNIDDGAGGTTAIGNNRWTVQRIYSFISNNVKIQRGIDDYPSLDAAVVSIKTSAYITEASIDANGLLRGWLVVKKGTTDLSGSNALFLEAPKFPGGSSAGGATLTTLQEAYLNSAPNPEILTDATNLALTLRRGSGADSDLVLDVQNGAGTSTFSVDGSGNVLANTVDGIDIGTDVAANTSKVSNATHTGDVTGATALTIANDIVSNAKAANMAHATIKARSTAATGDPEDVLISGLTEEASPATGDWILAEDASGDLVKIDPDNLGGGSNIFGSERSIGQAESESTTTSTTYQQKLRVTTGSLTAGDYRIQWSFQITNSDTDKRVKAQVDLDDSDVLEECFSAPKFADMYQCIGGFSQRTLTAGVHTIDIDFAAGGDGGTGKIDEARIEIFRVS